MGIREYNKVISIIKDNSFWIYGYGRVAKRFYRQVVKRGFIDNLCGFVVTDLSNIKEKFCEKEVVTLDMVDKNNLIIIAANPTSTDEIASNMTTNGYHNYYKVFFSMIDLEIGMPTEFGKLFLAKKFFTDSTSAYWIIAIYLAATRYKNQGICGKDIYIKMLSSWLGAETAEKDYNQFMRKVGGCEKNGFKQDYPIQICKDLYVLDGAHRLVLSQCFGNGKVLADVYDVSGEEWKKSIAIKTSVLDDDNLMLDYLTKEELKTLKSVSKKIT